MARSHPRPANGLDIPKFLAGFASKYGADALKGAVLLLRLKRPIDDIMSDALGLSCKHFHLGPSPWSHCVLIIEPYQGINQPIKIFDCTIRDKNGDVDWDMPLQDLLSKPLDQQGGIYPGHVHDYADKRVTRFGIKFMPDLTGPERDSIVASARTLSQMGYHYDIPDLLRALAHIVLNPPLPPPPKGLLHCSGFCQKAYFDALNKKGMFDTSVQHPEDATDDEIWYPDRGKRYPEQVRLPPRHRRPAPPAPKKEHRRRKA
jgi:hypothetical protein